MIEPKAIEHLQYTNHFVAKLPGDPEIRNYQRAVEAALYSRTIPTPVSAPKLLALVPEVARMLELTPEPSDTLVQVLSGNKVLPSMLPYAQCYGGHQFGSWARQLGDGRAITLSEVLTSTGDTLEIQLKGAGPTPYSRRGDGRAVLRSSVRELVCSEAMFHLGISTTRALGLVLTGDPVLRDMFYDGHPKNEPGAICTRVAPTFIRFGTFELPASRGDTATLTAITEFTIERYFAEIAKDDPARVAKMFAIVCERTIELVVHWMRVGFVHGVMNTDNMSIVGMTIDYGPYGWIEPFDPEWTPNTTDAQMGRYSFGNQPRIAIWNLMQLATALAPLCPDVGPLKQELITLTRRFDKKLYEMGLSKLGLLDSRDELQQKQDELLIHKMSDLLMAVETDMTFFFRLLAKLPTDSLMTHEQIQLHFADCFYAPAKRSHVEQEQLTEWVHSYVARTRRDGLSDQARANAMNKVNPIYVPRNYLLQEVIERVENGDTNAIAELMDVLRNPYIEQPGREHFAEKRPEWARSRAGCSTLSCSS